MTGCGAHSSPEICFLLLFMDGRLRCILPNGNERWCIRLPGCENFCRSYSCNISPMRRDANRQLLHCACPYCGMCGNPKSSNSSDGDLFTDSEAEKLLYRIAGEGLGSEVKCCMVLLPDNGACDDPSPSFQHWLIDTIHKDDKGNLVGVPIDVAVSHWNEHCCLAHSVVDLNCSESLYAEIDFETGKVLSALHTGRDSGVTELEMAPDDSDPFGITYCGQRVVVRYTIYFRTIYFPLLGHSVHVDPVGEHPSGAMQNYAATRWTYSYPSVHVEVNCLSAPKPAADAKLDHALAFRCFCTADGVVSELRLESGRFADDPGHLRECHDPWLSDSHMPPLISAYALQLQYNGEPRPLVGDRESDVNFLPSFTDRTDGANYACHPIPVTYLPGSVSEEATTLRGLCINDAKSGHFTGFFDRINKVFISSSLKRRGALTTELKLRSSHLSDTEITHKQRTLLSSTTVDDSATSVITDEVTSDGAEGDHSTSILLGLRDSDVRSSSTETEGALVIPESPSIVNRDHNGDCGDRDPTIGECQSFFDKNFVVLSLLGRGASGIVLLTRHRVTGIIYAVKIMFVRNARAKAEIVREARLHAVLNNRHLVRYYTCWAEDVTPSLMRQLIDVGLRGGENVQRICHAMGYDYLRSMNSGSLSLSGSQGVEWPRVDNNNGFFVGGPCLLPPPPLGGQAAGTYMGGYETPDDTSDSSLSTSTDSMQETYDNASSRSGELVHQSSVAGISCGQVVFLQLEYCNMTLAQRLGSRSGIDRLENIIIALQLISGLLHVHKSGVVHRDVKPANVFVDYSVQFVDMEDVSVMEEYEEWREDLKKHFAKEVNSSPDKVDDLDQQRNNTQISEVSLVGGIQTPHQTVMGFLMSQMSAPPLSGLLDQMKKATCELQKKVVVRLVRKWLTKRFVHVRLGDFGISTPFVTALSSTEASSSSVLVNDYCIGSPLYCSPEQLSGNVCTPATDTFSCGILFAEMYLQPKTVAERIVELQRVRKGESILRSLVNQYPELHIVFGLTKEEATQRLSLSDARHKLRKIVDADLLTFFTENGFVQNE
uniref:Protein kinase domain-containing protein n=1 Tax=Trypanosoma vivax (strain Y486) TaxID=1055687 RepID=G0TWW7_TRYVY|nr:putative protein kinase [Trypanosoma vivax Y486]